MAEVNVVGADLANLQIMEEEDEPLVLNGDAVSTDLNYELCLVGRVLTESIFNFPSLKNTMADLWHPLQGVSITEMEDRQILFRFYSEVDLKRVVDGMPWFFNRHLIVFHRVQKGEIPSAVPLWTTIFWVQSPLKRKKKISIGRNQCIYVLFQYEKLPLFCFLCGRLGHGENFCPIRLALSDQQVEFGWDISLRATPMRGRQVVSRWLRDDTNEGRWTRMELEGEPRTRRFEDDVTN
ncbi:hypothetical protein GOBAR_AA21229 [Gossypium barbadense]|uniref:CCHC-type domain-containing protein n=1 Tax=Gossypium barbadense TaxID=3634 RepID=A0A2P5X7Y1_GOSBA|nr:hypothetical protein GOBAR_AA21229 [Gossypium barbadense]